MHINGLGLRTGDNLEFKNGLFSVCNKPEVSLAGPARQPVIKKEIPVTRNRNRDFLLIGSLLDMVTKVLRFSAAPPG